MLENPRNITFCTHLLFCAKNFERIGDHATNIAESVYYIVQGHPLARRRASKGKCYQCQSDAIARVKGLVWAASVRREYECPENMTPNKKAACRCKRPR